MAIPKALLLFVFLATLINMGSTLTPYSKPLWDLMLQDYDPFRILEQNPLSFSKGAENVAVALAKADWKETQTSHVISLEVPGMTRGEIKVEVEENNMLKISGERKAEEEGEGVTWHRVERTAGMFWRQFKLPANADLNHISANLEDGVLKLTIPKLYGENKKKSRVIDILGSDNGSKDELK